MHLFSHYKDYTRDKDKDKIHLVIRGPVASGLERPSASSFFASGDSKVSRLWALCKNLGTFAAYLYKSCTFGRQRPSERRSVLSLN